MLREGQALVVDVVWLICVTAMKDIAGAAQTSRDLRRRTDQSDRDGHRSLRIEFHFVNDETRVRVDGKDQVVTVVCSFDLSKP